MREVLYPTPGEILLEEFLRPLGITPYRLAKEIGVPQIRIGEIVAGRRAITVDTGLRLSRFFGVNDGFWTGLQLDYDAAQARTALSDELARIKPLRPADVPAVPATAAARAPSSAAPKVEQALRRRGGPAMPRKRRSMGKRQDLTP